VQASASVKAEQARGDSFLNRGKTAMGAAIELSCAVSEFLLTGMSA